MKSKRPASVFISIAGFLIISVIVFLFISSSSQPPIVPNDIISQVNFPIFYPPVSQQMTVEAGSYRYAKSLGQVTFIVNFDNKHITFAEQSSPDSFAADPSFYTAFVQKLGGYANFDSVNGRVDLTRPAQVNNETGVMNAKGTLLFAKSTGDISEDNWKLLFNALDYTKPL